MDTVPHKCIEILFKCVIDAMAYTRYIFSYKIYSFTTYTLYPRDQYPLYTLYKYLLIVDFYGT